MLQTGETGRATWVWRCIKKNAWCIGATSFGLKLNSCSQVWEDWLHALFKLANADQVKRRLGAIHDVKRRTALPSLRRAPPPESMVPRSQSSQEIPRDAKRPQAIQRDPDRSQAIPRDPKRSCLQPSHSHSGLSSDISVFQAWGPFQTVRELRCPSTS